MPTVTLNNEHYANLLKLASYLRGLPIGYKHFDMGHFMELRGNYVPTAQAFEAATNYNRCGSSACAVGHGPAAGIEPLRTEYWNAYTIRAFGVEVGDKSVGDFMFGAHWHRRPDVNTPHEAARRIEAVVALNGKKPWPVRPFHTPEKVA